MQDFGWTDDELRQAWQKVVNRITAEFVTVSDELNHEWQRWDRKLKTFFQPVIEWNKSRTKHAQHKNSNSYTLWIDGVGAYRLMTGSPITVGGSRANRASSDIALLSNLSEQHAVIRRYQSEYSIDALRSVSIGQREIDGEAILTNGDEIKLGTDVRLRFRQPTLFSASATIEFVSDHRPEQSVDAIVLLADHCLLGPGEDSHVRCRGWDESIVLSHDRGRFFVKSRMPLRTQNRVLTDGGEIFSNENVTGMDVSFRLERRHI